MCLFVYVYGYVCVCCSRFSISDHCYRAWLLSDHRGELALPIVRLLDTYVHEAHMIRMKYMFIQWHLGSRFCVSVILLSCVMPAPETEIQRLLALANEYVPVCTAATIEWTDSESSASEEEPVAKQEQKRPRKPEKQLRQGAHLAKLKDNNRKRFHDMSATEQRVLEDYDSGKLQKHHDDARIRKPK